MLLATCLEGGNIAGIFLIFQQEPQHTRLLPDFSEILKSNDPTRVEVNG